MPFRRLPNVIESKYWILDNGIWESDKQYIDLGVREGWLILYRIVEVKGGTFDYQYRYPEGYKTE